METIAVRRIKKEVKEAMKSEELVGCPIKIEVLNDFWMTLKGEITGPPETPYEGGKFILNFEIPESYPFDPPKVKFITHIWHPNISSATGAICLDILKDQWAAAMTLRTVLLSLQALLSSPEPDDPQDAVVANQYKNNNVLFQMTARQWTHLYAGGPDNNPYFDEKLRKLADLGVSDTIALVALSSNEWDLEKATEYIFP
ncbi:ubiquitin conjugating enzyme 4 [Arctopsyche grandis]|uniref:ubiquitin conjugating enzyme 4 n=1 Tax=Arctopsyche grandis TaxID=121162 RepID=UPI00406D7605